MVFEIRELKLKKKKNNNNNKKMKNSEKDNFLVISFFEDPHILTIGTLL